MAIKTGFGRVNAERAALEATYEDALTIHRPQDEADGVLDKVEWKPAGSGLCALSRSGGNPGSQTDAFNLIEYDAVIITVPELEFREGDRVEVVRFGRYDPASALQYAFEPVGAPAVYPTHQEVAVKVRDKA